MVNFPYLKYNSMCYLYLNTSGYNPCRMGWLIYMITLWIALAIIISIYGLKFYSIIQDVTNTCGDSVWKAAKLGGRFHSKKDQTGVMLATCRHSLILKALDMHRGEIYEYPYLLQASALSSLCLWRYSNCCVVYAAVVKWLACLSRKQETAAHFYSNYIYMYVICYRKSSGLPDSQPWIRSVATGHGWASAIQRW